MQLYFICDCVQYVQKYEFFLLDSHAYILYIKYANLKMDLVI